MTHETFTIERTYRAAVERVFDAWADPVKKRRWFVEGEGFQIDSHSMDFKVHGFERSRFRPQDGPAMTLDSVYHVIVPNQCIVNSYDMTVDGKPLSVSLSTLTFESQRAGTLLRYTEQVVFFDGMDGLESRRRGCQALMDKLAGELGEAGEKNETPHRMEHDDARRML